MKNRRSYLSTYLEDGRCSFSNNLSENAVRPFTVGRKNWLFCDTPNGAQASAIVYTMVEIEYSCAVKSHFRKSGNQMSGKWKSSYARLLA